MSHSSSARPGAGASRSLAPRPLHLGRLPVDGKIASVRYHAPRPGARAHLTDELPQHRIELNEPLFTAAWTAWYFAVGAHSQGVVKVCVWDDLTICLARTSRTPIGSDPMKYLPLRVVCLSVLLGVASPALADPIQFTFTGTLGLHSALTYADGTTIDLSFQPFTVTGTTVGADPRLNELSQAQQDGFSSFLLGAMTWEVGDLVTLTTEPGGGYRYTENYSATPEGRAVTLIGLRGWDPNQQDLIGFLLQIAPTPAAPQSVPPEPTALGTLEQFATIAPFIPFYMSNQAGDLLTLGASGGSLARNIQITSGEITTVPEPATLALLAMGAGALFVRTRHRH